MSERPKWTTAEYDLALKLRDDVRLALSDGQASAALDRIAQALANARAATMADNTFPSKTNPELTPSQASAWKSVVAWCRERDFEFYDPRWESPSGIGSVLRFLAEAFTERDRLREACEALIQAPACDLDDDPATLDRDCWIKLRAALAKGGGDEPAKPRTEPCSHCGNLVTEWADPDWWTGRLCSNCESLLWRDRLVSDPIDGCNGASLLHDHCTHCWGEMDDCEDVHEECEAESRRAC